MPNQCRYSVEFQGKIVNCLLDAGHSGPHVSEPRSLSVNTKRCIVWRCTNTNDPEQGGTFVGDMCSPCHEFVTTGVGKWSQAYRNSLDVTIQRFGDRLRQFIGDWHG